MAEGGNRKILRIGIIQNKEFVEERLLRKRHSVTVGQTAKNTFAVPSGSLPDSHTLFELKGGVYHLRVLDGMTGKVGVDESSLTLSALKAKGLAKPHPAGGLDVPLSDRSRGRIVMGDVVLLFQFVVPPPPPSRLQLPAAVRGGILNTLDWPFVTTLLASFVVQVFSVAFIVTRDYPEPPRGIENLDDRFVKILQNKPEIKITPKATEAKEDEEKDPEKTEPKEEVKKKPEKKKKVEKVVEEARKKAREKRRIATNVRRKTIIGVLGTKGGDGDALVKDLLGGGAADVAMKDAFDGTVGLVADGSAGRPDSRRKISGTGSTADLGAKDLTAKGPAGPVKSGKKGREVKVSGKVKIKRLSNDEMVGTGVLDSNSVSRVVSRRSKAIKNCYEKRLKVNNKLKGKVKIRFTIEQSGRVSKASVAQNTTGDSVVGSCIVSQIKRWRFPKPDGGSVTVSFPFLFTPSS